MISATVVATTVSRSESLSAILERLVVNRPMGSRNHKDLPFYATECLDTRVKFVAGIQQLIETW